MTAALTTAFAELIGAENVAAVDPSQPFVEACRERVPAIERGEHHHKRLPHLHIERPDTDEAPEAEREWILA